MKSLTTVFFLLISTSAFANSELRAAAENLDRLHNLVVMKSGDIIIEESVRGPNVYEASNIKSLSKSVQALLVGIAIDKGYIESVDQKAVELLGSYLPDDYDPAFAEVSIGNLLSMQSGLERTSGANYGIWVNSANWTQYALTRPMIAEPGTRMLYSTGNSHILAAILTEQTGKSLLQITREWVGQPLNIRIHPWLRSPEGVYFGGNEMYLSTRALVYIGEVYRNQGVVNDQRLVSSSWVEQSFTPRTRSVYTDDPYGYGWFLYSFDGVQAYYGRGYGGQVLYVIPELELSIAITSDPTPPSRGIYLQQLHKFVSDYVLDAVAAI
ncbi:serine hydrolase domain-containing protein [Aliidiomarina minuta]|nr:serine hydrolase [Aliidiomarina minuta]